MTWTATSTPTLTVVVPTETTAVMTSTTPLPLLNGTMPAGAGMRLPTATAASVKPTPVLTPIAFDHNPRAILVEADIAGGLAPAPYEAHVPLFRLYGDGFVVFAGEQTPLSTGLDATVRTGNLSETAVQELLAFLRDCGFQNLEPFHQPKPVAADLPTARITLNLNKAKTVRVYAPGFSGAPSTFYDAFGRITRSAPENSKSFTPTEGYLVALPAGAVSDFRSKDVLAEWTPTIGVRLADAIDGVTVSGNAYANIVSLVGRTFPNTLYREADRVFRVLFEPQLPRAVHRTDWVGTILQAPREFDGRAFDIIGYYRGANLLGEARGNPPVTKNDWVIADQSGAIYVTGALPPGLEPQSRADIWNLVRLRAVVVYVRLGTSYMEARKVQVLEHEVPGIAPLSPSPSTPTLTPLVSSTPTAVSTAAPSSATLTVVGTLTRASTALPTITTTISATANPAAPRLATRAPGNK